MFPFFLAVEWMKKRWSYLREQYVRHLKQLNNVESDKPSKKNYKYFNEMSFLANHIQIRNSNYQDVISTNVTYKPVASVETNSRTESYNIIEADKDDDVLESETVDFVITENEIEAYNDDDDDLADNLFVELSDEEKDEQEEQFHPNDSSDMDLIDPSTLVTLKPMPKHDNEPTHIPPKPVYPASIVFEEVNSPELRMTEEHLSTDNVDVPNGDCQVVSKTTESRCEDAIFGELVTSMLKKMDSPNRKRAKKEILNILLS